MAWECPARAGYHVDADSVIIEIVDDDGRPVRPGQTGRAIATGLINRMMPLIRYELGDLLVASDRRCTCGRTLPMIEGIEGRMKDRIPLPGGGLRTARELLEPFGAVDGVELFRLTIEDPARAQLEVVTPDPRFAQVRQDCIERFAEACPGVALAVQRVDDIEKAPTGKRVLLRNRVAPRTGGASPVFVE
jgi:phenylacetate-CoA ligase